MTKYRICDYHNHMNIAQNLTILSDRGLSQKEIGDQLGIAQSTVSELMSEKLKSVRYETGKKLEALLLQTAPPET